MFFKKDPNNLLTKYNINVDGAKERVDVEFRESHNKVALIFTGIYKIDDMQAAMDQLSAAIPERLGNTIGYGKTGDEFTMYMPPGTYEELTGQKLSRGRTQSV